MNTPLTSRRFGVEIECFAPMESSAVASAIAEKGIPIRSMSYTHTVMDQWKIVTDGSLSANSEWNGHWYGIEVVSPPMRGEEGFRQLKVVCETLQSLGCKINKTSGLHVHIEIKNLSWAAEVGEAALCYSEYESAVFDQMLPQSRRGNANNYCRSLTSMHLERFLSQKHYTTTSQIASQIGTRYCKVNLQSYTKYGTMEFRHHSGTIEYDKISSWVVILQGVIKVAQTRVARFGHLGRNWDGVSSRSWEDFQNEFRNILPRETLTYIQRRMNRVAD
jgi:hypothetical protein